MTVKLDKLTPETDLSALDNAHLVLRAMGKLAALAAEMGGELRHNPLEEEIYLDNEKCGITLRIAFPVSLLSEYFRQFEIEGKKEAAE
jgi:hypothetical protein